jgi:Cu+-exporting ATPase
VGDPTISGSDPSGSDLTSGLLRLVAALELASEHPLGTAIVKEAAAHLTLPAAARFESVTGQGVAGEIEGHTVVGGTPTFLSDRGVDVSVLDADAAVMRSEGQTIVFEASTAGLLVCSRLPIASKPRRARRSPHFVRTAFT